MNPGQLGTIIILVLILIVIGSGFVIYRRIRKKLRDFSNMVFGTPDLVQGLKSVEKETEITPKSVAAATSLYLPNIMRDFPEFHYDEMKSERKMYWFRLRKTCSKKIRNSSRRTPANCAIS